METLLSDRPVIGNLRSSGGQRVHLWPGFRPWICGTAHRTGHSPLYSQVSFRADWSSGCFNTDTRPPVTPPSHRLRLSVPCRSSTVIGQQSRTRRPVQTPRPSSTCVPGEIVSPPGTPTAPSHHPSSLDHCARRYLLHYLLCRARHRTLHHRRARRCLHRQTRYPRLRQPQHGPPSR